MHDGLRYSTTTRRIEPRLPMMSSNPHVLTRPARKWCKKSVYGLSDKLRQSFVCFSVWIYLFIYFLHTSPAGNSISYDGANLLLGTKGRSGSPGQHGWDFGGGNVYLPYEGRRSDKRRAVVAWRAPVLHKHVHTVHVQGLTSSTMYAGPC